MRAVIMTMALSALFASFQAAADVYRLRDGQGGVQYTDRLPPHRVQEGYEVLDEQGRLKRSLPPVQTPEQREEQQRRAQEERRLEQARREQERRDQMLLQLYASEEAIYAARDARLADLHSQSNIIKHQLKANRERLAWLKREHPNHQEIPELERRNARDQAALGLLDQKREQIMRQFADDLQRWRWLHQPRGTVVAPASP